MAPNNDQQLLDEIRAEATFRSLPQFTRTDAMVLGSTALSLAQQGQHPVVIRVQRGAQVVFHAAREGTTAEHDDWVRRKINTAVLHEVSSLELVLRQRVAGRTPDWLDPREYAVAGGAVPIEVGGMVVGVIAVSGLVNSMRADHDLAMSALRDTGFTAWLTDPARHFEAPTTSASR